MKTTYTRTLFVENLKEAKITLYLLNGCKYTSKSIEEIGEVTYTGVTSWDIIQGGNEAEEIESTTDKDGIDEFNEYLVLHFENGETATFRNTHVDMFIR